MFDGACTILAQSHSVSWFKNQWNANWRETIANWDAWWLLESDSQSKWNKCNLFCSERRQFHVSTEKLWSSQTTGKIDSWVKMSSLPCPRRTTCWSLVASEHICPVNPPDAWRIQRRKYILMRSHLQAPHNLHWVWWKCVCPLTIQQYKVKLEEIMETPWNDNFLIQKT